MTTESVSKFVSVNSKTAELCCEFVGVDDCDCEKAELTWDLPLSHRTDLLGVLITSFKNVTDGSLLKFGAVLFSSSLSSDKYLLFLLIRWRLAIPISSASIIKGTILPNISHICRINISTVYLQKSFRTYPLRWLMRLKLSAWLFWKQQNTN